MELPSSSTVATPGRLRYLTAHLGVSEKAFRRAFELAGHYPDAGAWRHTLDRGLLLIGAALILAGIASFLAYNWDELERFGKFALLETGIVAAAAIAWWRGLDSPEGKVALFSAAFLSGLLLAVYGQVYQNRSFGHAPHHLLRDDQWCLSTKYLGGGDHDI